MFEPRYKEFDIHEKHVQRVPYDKKLYDRYYHMIDRCTNTKCEAYPNYGGRGIIVCDEWINSKQSFFVWSVENGYSKDLELDRTDNTKGYSPDNCRYITRKENRNNRRDSRILTE